VTHSHAYTYYVDEVVRRCFHEPTTHVVSRYDFQFEQQYQPPDWQAELRWTSVWELGESAPRCRPAGAGGNQIRAVMYVAGP
jgi:hypothetical protein